MNDPRTPPHYRRGGYECDEVATAIGLTDHAYLYCIFKYAWRCGHKGGPEDAVTDLRKIIHYAEAEIARRTAGAHNGND